MNKPMLLVVEDDATVRNLICTALKANDYRYLTAPNGETALSHAAASQPDIILLDLGLPDLDGVEVIRRIRSWSLMPIIVISARSEDADKIAALDAGADDYLTKPFSGQRSGVFLPCRALPPRRCSATESSPSTLARAAPIWTGRS